jgi:uncharacterized protein
MKSKLLIALGLVILLAVAGLTGCSAVGAGAADIQPISVNVNGQQGIMVNGVGRITVTPDITTITLGVVVQAVTVADAQAQAATAMANVMTALIANGIDKKDIQTQYFSITPITNYYKSGSAVAPSALPVAGPPYTPENTFNGYQVSNLVTIKVRAVEKTGSLVDAVTKAGGDYIKVNGVYFSIDQPEKYYNQVRTLAMSDARSKAASLASLAGVNLGKANMISENAYMPSASYAPLYREDIASGGASSPVSPGQSDIVLNVQVNYTIQ